MKLKFPDQNRRRQRGFFLVVVMFIFISIMMIYGVANHRRLANLRQEIKLVEQKQLRRLDRLSSTATNTPPTTLLAPNTTTP